MRAKLQLLKQKIISLTPRQLSIILVIIILIIVPILIVMISRNYNSKDKPTSIAESKYLYITDYHFDQERTFYFEFSDPVDIHHLEHHFSIFPEIDGELQKDGRGNKKFKFVSQEDADIPDNSTVNITIMAGLTSENRKPFIEDFIMSFRNEIATRENVFFKNNLNYNVRVLSFDEAKPFEIDLKRKMTLNVYKSDNANLLNFLVYESKNRTVDSSYDYYYETYLRDQIPHSKDNLIESRVIKENESTQKFDLDSGTYYLEATDGKKKVYGAIFVLVNKNGVILRQDDNKVTLANFNLNSGNKHSSDAEVFFYNMEGAPKIVAQERYTNGFARGIPIPFSQRVDAALITLDGETVFAPLKLPSTQAEIQARRDLENTSKIFLYTDRPIYKPGDNVYFRGIVRNDSDSLYKLPTSGTPIYITFDGQYTGNNTIKVTALTDSKGVFSGNFTIPKDFKVNPDYSTESIYASISPNYADEDYYERSYAYANFDVEEYIKPEFELKVESLNKEVLRHENPKFVITGKYFSGKPMANETVKYTVYTTDFYESEKIVYNKNFNINKFGGMCSGGSIDDYYGSPLEEGKTIKLDANGQATVEAPKDDDSLLSQSLTLVVEKTDKAENVISGADSSIRHAGAFNLFLIPSSSTYKPGESIQIPFYAEELGGDKVANKEFSYRLINVDYSAEKSKDNTLLSGKTTTDGDGKGNVSLTLPTTLENRNIYVIIEGNDRFGNKVENRKSLYIVNEKENNYRGFEQEDNTLLKITSAQNSYQLGQMVNLSVNSPEELDVLLTFERGRIYNPQILHLTKGENKITIPVTVEHSPSITPVFSFFHNGKYYTEGLSLNIPAMHKLLNVSVNPDKSEYKNGETAQIKIQVRDASGNPVAVQLSLGIVDKAIYALKKSATPAVHSALYYFRDRSTNASSSLTWVGVFDCGCGGGGGGGGMGSANKQVDTLYWNPNIQTDASGEVTLSVPLGNTVTTWKANAIGSNESTDVGQADAEFLVK